MAIQQGKTTWRKSSYSLAHGDCVEVASPVRHTIAVRDSKDPQRSSLAFTPENWSAFVAVVNDGSRAL